MERGMNERREWMWVNALDALARAERMHQQFFQPSADPSRRPCWEPPLDVYETEHEVVVVAALPGVPPDRVSARIEGGTLVIEGERPVPEVLRRAQIHRMELPQGRFERRVALPRGVFHSPQVHLADGCLIVGLAKA
jgi:HSP20 family protein